MAATGETTWAAPGKPDRAALFDQVLAWSVAGVIALAVVVLFIRGVRVGELGLVGWAGMLAVVAIRPTLGAWTMSQAPGRFVFVVDRARVVGSSGRWADRLWNPLRHGHWVCLLDAETEGSLGWIEVGWLGSHRLRDAGVAALFGDPRRRGRTVLTGSFRPVHAIGRSLPALFEPWARIQASIRQPLRRLPPSPGAPISDRAIERS